MRRSRKVKILATLGPASSDEATIRRLFEAGADVFRINMSHTDHDLMRTLVGRIRAVEAAVGRPIGILADLQGPKLRVGKFADGKVDLSVGQTFVLDDDPTPGDATRVHLPHPEILRSVEPGHRLLIDDGRLELVAVETNGRAIVCTVVSGTKISDKKGVSLPDTDLPVGALTEKDRRDLDAVLATGVDWVALSFIQRPEDLAEARKISRGRAAIMSKIEKPQAVARLAEIIELSDALMVARGDLGVEMPLEAVPGIQKQITRAARRAGKPVVVATQMLESMIANPRPTRAEANDVANAILDGTDAVMLSAETAAGQYPVEAVRMMKDIAMSVEASAIFKTLMHKNVLTQEDLLANACLRIEDAVHFATMDLADKVCARYIVGFTNSGASVLGLAKFRPLAPLIAFSPKLATLRKLALVWGVTPLQLGIVVTSVDDLLSSATEFLLNKGMTREGEIVVFTAGVPVGVSGGANMIKVVKVERAD